MINVCRIRAQMHHILSLGAVEIRCCIRGQQNLKCGCKWNTARFIQGTKLCPFWQVINEEAALSFESVQIFKVKISCN